MTAEPAPAPAPEGESRYERKFRALGIETELIHAVILSHPAGFREAHPPRPVCNIYFDTPDASFLSDHVNGELRRAKIRLRWYGAAERIGSPVALEIKTKEGAVTRKTRLILDDELARGRPFQWPAFGLGGLGLPESLRARMSTLRPALFNRYDRRYFLSRDGRYRISAPCLRPGCERHGDPAVVLELKYDVALATDAPDVSSHFPFPLSKNSKYVTGMLLVRRAP
jgi:hypothetical protein